MIEIKDIVKGYEQKVIFDHWSEKIQDGEFVIINGESGKGKTTLLNIIGSLEEVESGEVLVDGKNIFRRKNQREYLKNRVGFLFQNFALMESKTVEQNMKLVKPGIRSDFTLEECLDFVGVLELKKQKVYMLSGGEQQRVALARLLFKKCDIILADEPTGSLDKKNAQKVMTLLKKLNEMGKTIIMVTHDETYKNYGTRRIEL